MKKLTTFYVRRRNPRQNDHQRGYGVMYSLVEYIVGNSHRPNDKWRPGS